MSLQPPFKLLEINIISAQGLPPVSKMLRTFAVVYTHPDHKLTTRVDHTGHTNPTWNYNVVFHVDDKFLKNESSCISIEIYNVAWLRDLPIGTTRFFINHLSPPLHKNSTFRRVPLQICRPSGHLQGTLNVDVQLVDNRIPGNELIVPPIKKNVEQLDDPIQDSNREEDGDVKEENNWNKLSEKDSISDLMNMTTKKGNMSPTFDDLVNAKAHRPEHEPETKTMMTYTSYGSRFSAMRPLPSEVADDMKKGVYYGGLNEYGSSVFENWTDPSNRSEDHGLMRSNSIRWETDDDNLIPLRSDHKKPGCRRKERSNSKKGLMSCFGNAYGFQFSFVCGSKTMKKKMKNRNGKHDIVHLMSLPQENLHRFYV